MASKGRFVVKRDGTRQKWSFDKITARIERLCGGLSQVEPEVITQAVASRIRDGITTVEIDTVSAEIADNMLPVHPQYRELGGRILVSNNHKNTPESFSAAIEVLNDNVDRKGRRYELFSAPFLQFVRANAAALDAAILHENDYRLNYVQFRTFEDTYVLKKRVVKLVEKVDEDGKPVTRREEQRVVYERPQYVWMREAIQVNGYANLERVLRVYRSISEGKYTHATPTILNSGFIFNTCISCYLDVVRDDSLDEIYKLLQRCAKHSQGAGGIGFDVSNVRARGGEIRSSGGSSNGLVPMLKNFNETANYVDQCFHPSTRVLTAEGFRTIDSIQENDRVLTLDGSFQPVTRVLTNVVRDGAPLIRLHLNTGNQAASVLMTRNHPFLALHNRGAQSPADLMALLDAGLQPEFVASEELLVGDYVCIPVPQLAYPQESYGADDLELYALLLTGAFAVSEDFSVLHYIRGQAREDAAPFLERYIRKHFLEHEVTAEHVKIFVTHRFKFTRAMLFDARGELYVHPRLLHAGLDQVEVVVRAVIRLCGFEPVVRSLAVAEALYYWALRLGVLVDFEENQLARGGRFPQAGQARYVVRFPRDFWAHAAAQTYSVARKGVHHFKHGGRFYSQIAAIEEAHHQGAVYDLEVNKNKNYVTELGLVHNGGGKRKGSFAVYLEPWHADILEVISAMGIQGDDRKLTRDLFFAIWMNDLFMERMRDGGMWSLMCPDTCPGLHNVYGEEFRRLYCDYEAKGLYTQQLPARDLYVRLAKLQIERGRPYVVFKDWSNEASNQKNIGVVRSSNLCAEILEVANERYTACCNLASIALPVFVRDGAFDFAALVEAAAEATENLNNVIDHNHYMTPDTELANMETRPIALGVQGLADVFALLGLPFASAEALALDRKIYEHIYFGALRASVALARRDGPYPRFAGSPFSQGILQFDHYRKAGIEVPLSPELDWEGLRADVVRHGTRNSLLTASMPTASTAILLGNSEGFEPYPSMLVAKSNKTGRFLLLNKHFVQRMEERGLWSHEMFERVKEADGYVSNLDCVPADLRALFTGAYEMPQKEILNHAAARQPFLDQSQSMNLFFSRRRIAEANPGKNPDQLLVQMMGGALQYAWQLKLKTGVYYTRTEAATTAQKRSSAPVTRPAASRAKAAPAAQAAAQAAPPAQVERKVIECNDEDGCLMCQS